MSGRDVYSPVIMSCTIGVAYARLSEGAVLRNRLESCRDMV